MAFSHEKLEVYQKSIDFVAWTKKMQTRLPEGSSAIRAQIDRASISIPLNIAEGNAKRSPKDRSRFFQIAQGSAVESAACIDVIIAQGFRTEEDLSEGKQMLLVIVRMLHGLIERFGHGDLVRESEATYGIRNFLFDDD